MAYTDLTPEQLQGVEAALLAPPPPSLRQNAVVPGSPESNLLAAAKGGLFGNAGKYVERFLQNRPASVGLPVENQVSLAAQSGMFGRAGRVVDLFAREQAKNNAAQRAQEASAALSSINPLDPQYYQKVTALQQQYGPAFTEPVVQQAAQLGRAQREEATQAVSRQKSEADKEREARAAAFLRQANPDQIEALWAADPRLASKVSSFADAREKEVQKASELAASVPQHLLKDVDVTNPHKVAPVVESFRRSLPPVLKNADFNSLQGLVDTAEKWQKAADTFKTDAKNTSAADEASNLAEQLGAMLNTSGKPLADAQIREIAKVRDKITNPLDKYKPTAADVARPDVQRLIQSLR